MTKIPWINFEELNRLQNLNISFNQKMAKAQRSLHLVSKRKEEYQKDWNKFFANDDSFLVSNIKATKKEYQQVKRQRKVLEKERTNAYKAYNKFVSLANKTKLSEEDFNKKERILFQACVDADMALENISQKQKSYLKYLSEKTDKQYDNSKEKLNKLENNNEEAKLINCFLNYYNQITTILENDEIDIDIQERLISIFNNLLNDSTFSQLDDANNEDLVSLYEQLLKEYLLITGNLEGFNDTFELSNNSKANEEIELPALKENNTSLLHVLEDNDALLQKINIPINFKKTISKLTDAIKPSFNLIKDASLKQVFRVASIATITLFLLSAHTYIDSDLPTESYDDNNDKSIIETVAYEAPVAPIVILNNEGELANDIISFNHVQEETNDKQEQIEVIEDLVEENEFQKQIIEEACHIYGLDSDKVYTILKDLTENFTSEDYLVNYTIPGFKFKKMEDIYEPDEKIRLIQAVRWLGLYKTKYTGYDKNELKSDNITTSDNYAQTTAKFSSLLGIDPNMAYSIMQLECGHFSSNIFKKGNNPGGIIISQIENIPNSSYSSFPTVEAGILEECFIIWFYQNRGINTIVELSTPYCKENAQNWAKIVTSLYNSNLDKYEELFYLEEDYLSNIIQSETKSDNLILVNN